MLEENLEDAGGIIQNILTQPLILPGASDESSLLQAAQSFKNQEPIASDLRKIMLSFLQFPDPTRTMLRELEIIEEELH